MDNLGVRLGRNSDHRILRLCAPRCSVLVLVLILFGCEDFGIDVPPDISIPVLLMTPDTVVVEGRSLTLSTYLWRNFMPMTTPNSTRLIALICIGATDTSKLPPSLSSDALWIVNEQQVWKSFFTNEMPASCKKNQLSRIARDGPLWDGYVDVVVRLFDSQGSAHFLKASHQYIGRVY